jgi:ribosomal protein S18 acetylase RimI-like enzyme
MTLRKHGLLTQLLDQLRRVGIRINPCFLFREGVGPHQADWPELAREFPSSVLKRGDSADVAAIAGFESWRTLERVRARLEKGDLCVMLKKEGRIVGFTWADFDGIDDVACDYKLNPCEAYLYDAVIAPEYRGRGLAAYMRAESYKQLRGTGHHTFYSVSDCSNTPAIKFKQRLNAEITRLYLQIKLGKRLLGNWQLRNYERKRTKIGAPRHDLGGT